MKVPEEHPPLSTLEQSLKRVLLEKAANTDSRLAERVLTIIGARTPRQLSVEQTLRIMRAVSAVDDGRVPADTPDRFDPGDRFE